MGPLPAAQLEEDAARAARRPVEFAREQILPLCFALPPIDRRADEDKVWGASLDAPEIVPTCLLLLCFFFPDQRSGLRRPVVRRRFIIDTSEDEVVAAPSQTAAPMLVVKPSSPVSPPLQAMAPSAADPRQADTRSESAPTAVFVRTSPSMLLKEDARALFSYLVYHRHRPLTDLLLSSSRSC